MTDERQICGRTRDELRAYALDTLRNGARRNLDAHLETCAACQAVLEEEHRALAQLDLLPDAEPSQDLVAATQRRIRLAQPEARGFRLPHGFVSAVVSLCIVGVLSVILLPALARSREAARRSSAQNNLKQIGLVLKMYAGESEGELYPPPAPYEGMWVPDLRVLFPEYLTDPSILINPSLVSSVNLYEELNRALHHDPPDWETAHRIAAQTIVYTGWALRDEADVRAFAQVPEAVLRNPETRDIQAGGRTLYRLREGIERFFITDINNPAATARMQSAIPTVFENVAIADQQHVPRGCNILYLDGHVLFMRFGKEFPVDATVGEAFPPPPLAK